MMKKKTFLTVFAALACWLVHGNLVINEVCYDNSAVADETGDKTSDWIELYNSGSQAINVGGYGVGDSKSTLDTYEEENGVLLPAYILPPGGFLLVFASSSISLPETNRWVNAPDIALIPSNSVWRYYASSSAPTPAVPVWHTNTFNDATWAQGMSPLGYNDPKLNLDCATLLSYGGNPSSRYTAAYFRNTFRVLNPSVVTGLLVNARINDGMVVYLNGREVYRYNLPAGTVNYSTLALTSLPSTLQVSLLLPTNGLIQGSNVLGVEVHQAAAASPDLIMDLSLTALVDEQVPFVHGSFGLSAAGEKVHLFYPSFAWKQTVPNPGTVGENKSYGTVTDGGTASFKVYDPPTPRLPNATYNGLCKETLASEQRPVLSPPPGVYVSNQNVTFSSSQALARIYYTLDGSDPRKSTLTLINNGTLAVNSQSEATSGPAWLRTNPVEISDGVPTAAWLPPIGSVTRATVIRAVAISLDGTQCSPETQGTYLIGPAFTNRVLPIVSLTTDTNNLFNFATGLFVPGKYYGNSPEGYGLNKWGKPYANYHQDSNGESWERPVHFELFEPAQNTSSASLLMGAAMYGGGTRAIPQKTLYMMARLAEYGADRVNYPLFPGEAPSSYKRFLLRNSGNDWYGPDTGVATMLKDAVFHRIVKNLDLSVMAYRPAVAYVNGHYWGIHNVRESYDKHYLNTRYGIDADNADILMHEEDPANEEKVVITRVDGDKSADEDYELMLEWISTNALSNASNYQQVQSWIDVANYTDYIIAETFFANTDWPVNNCDFWRAHTNEVASCGEYGDTRWRWMLYDLDVAGEKGSDYNMFSYLTSSKMTGLREPGFLFNALLANMNYTVTFVTRYANLLNSSFRPERSAELVTQAAAAIAPEIETHFRRWGRTTTQSEWSLSVSNAIVQYAAARQAASWSHLSDHFSLGGTGLLTVCNSDASGTGGCFTVNGMVIDTTTDGVTNRAYWTGMYFRNLGVAVQAVPDAGYVFDGWKGSTLTAETRYLAIGQTPQTVVARFRLSSAPAYVASGFEQWQLANYSEQEIVGGVVAEPAAPSGLAGMSNFELYAYGMHRNDGLTDAQRVARASLSIRNSSTALWVGYYRLNDSFTDVRYTLKYTASLHAPTLWSNAVTGVDLEAEALTNTLNASTWFYEVKLPGSTPARETRFFKLEAAPQ
jgi:hypothetical protein